MSTNDLITALRTVFPGKEQGLETGEWIAILAAIAAIASVVVAVLALRNSSRSAAAAERSANVASQANGLAERIAKREGVIDLHLAWRGVNRFNPAEPIFPDAINAANALDLTASLWNHDVLEKELLFQSYWKWFKEFHRVLSNCDIVMPADGRRISDLISPSVTLAYKQMETWELRNVQQTTMTPQKR